MIRTGAEYQEAIKRLQGEAERIRQRFEDLWEMGTASPPTA